MSQRTDRLDSQIRQELMELLQREMKDPRVGFATITRVETARDLGSARVWVSVLGTPEEQQTAMKALTDAAPWLRRQLGERLTVRHIPQLMIKHDDSIEAGDRVLRLLRELEQERSDEP
ncbi:MAG TPA: 30S ribosome-binding factor RbfA [Candidatus Limnocylindria bacterium]|jgi:ribosome-binding factor A|nr:30S ribosome-binding factor RbfA [Candidatus Limnocylindria bacterium]